MSREDEPKFEVILPQTKKHKRLTKKDQKLSKRLGTHSSSQPSERTIDFKQAHSQIFLQQNVFVQEQQRIAIRDMMSNGEPLADPKKQRGKFFLKGEDKFGKTIHLLGLCNHSRA